MKRKIKITESQYNKLQEFLFETTNINDTLDYVKTGDILNFKSINGGKLKLNVVNVDQSSGEILCQTNNGDKFKFYFDSYNPADKKINIKKLDKNTNNFNDIQIEVTDLDIIRNGKIIEIPTLNLNKEPIEPQQNKPIGNDEISKPIDLEPNTPIEDTPEEDNDNSEKLKTYGKKALKMITSDPILQKAFYRQPSFWKLFIADLNGKTVPGEGIYPTMSLLTNYEEKKKRNNNPDLEPFKMGHKADFEMLESVNFYVGDKSFQIPKNDIGSPYVATNMQSNFFDDSLRMYKNANMLQSSDRDNNLGFNFKIMVKFPEIKNDIYNCDIVYKSTIVARDIKIKFLNSRGYNHGKEKN